MVQKNNQTTALFLSFVLALFFFGFSKTSVAVESEEIVGDVVWSENKTIDAKEIFIAADSSLTIKKGITITFKNGADIYNAGRFIIKGTVKEPVKFTSADDSGYSIYSDNGSTLNFRSIEIEKGGVKPVICKNCDFGGSGIGEPVLRFFNANVDIQQAKIHHNIAGISAEGNPDEVVVNRSLIYSNSEYNADGDSNQSKKFNFKYNWWGSKNGPVVELNDIDYSDWMNSPEVVDPVIIIPGIFASFEKDGFLRLDPVLHTYDGIIAEFKNAGYLEEKKLFENPYDWRNSNVDSAALLHRNIELIKEKTHWPKVDIVAHSMGGLLARQYIESADYDNDVDQLITIATSQLGAPESYLSWEGGEEVGVPGVVMKKYLEQVAKEDGYADLFQYIRMRPVESLKELLPDYAYLKSADTGKLLDYLLNHPRNIFLENLNDQKNTLILNSTEFTKIIGKVDSPTSTIVGMNVVKYNKDDKWEHGYPSNFEVLIFSDRGLIKGEGDGTVPFISSKSEKIPSDTYIEINSSHRDAPSNSSKDVLEILTGTRPLKDAEKTAVDDILMVQVFSPLDIQIIDPDRNIVGKDFEKEKELNQIPGAYYSGFKTNTEFVTIPNPKNGNYAIVSRGTGSGEFTIIATKISEGNTPLDAIQSEISFSGSTTEGEQKQFEFTINGTQVSKQNASESAPQEKIETQSATHIEVVQENSEIKSDHKDGKKKKNSNEKIIVQLQSKQNLAQILKNENNNSENIFQQIADQKGEVKGEETLQSPVNQSENQSASKNPFVLAFQYFLAILLGYFIFAKFIKKA